MASDCRMGVVTESRDDIKKSLALKESINKGYTATSNLLYDLNEDDSDSIQLEDRKHITNGLGHMNIDLCHKSNVF